MENAFSYVTESQPRMQGGDSRYNRLAQSQIFKDANPDLELEAKTKKVTEKMSESLNVIANEPSLAFFRIQEHVRKCLPQLAETKHEVQDIQAKVQGASFDAEYAANAVKGMHKSHGHFQNVQDLLKNAMFSKQQLDYENNRREQKKLQPSMYSTVSSPDIAGGGRVSPVTHPSSSRYTAHKRRGPRMKRVILKPGGPPVQLPVMASPVDSSHPPASVLPHVSEPSNVASETNVQPSNGGAANGRHNGGAANGRQPVDATVDHHLQPDNTSVQ